MRLFLSGGGSTEKSIELDRLFAQSVGKSKPLLYIPIAIDKASHPYPECLKWIKGTFHPLGIDKIELWTEEDLRARKETELNRFGGVYIGGGNTFYLLNELRASGFLPKLKRMIEMDIPVYGGSAGALICARTISTSHDQNLVKLKDLSGMDLVRGHELWVHYQPEEQTTVQKYQKEHGSKVIALPEDCALMVSDKTIKVIGPGSAVIFDGKKKEIKPGKNI